MQLPVQITYRDFSPSPALTAEIEERARKLEQFYDRITSCRVAVGLVNHNHNKGNLYSVRVDITLPGKEIAVCRERGRSGARADAFNAVHDAFDVAQRKLQNTIRRRRVRVHMNPGAAPPRGKIVRLLRDSASPDDAYGFLETEDGRELYFHSHSLRKAPFDRLEVGMEVRYAEEMGEKGPQASTVEPS